MSTSNKIDPSEIDKEINLLKFPKDPKTYEYNPTEFEYVDIIESSRHIVKEFCYKPLNIKMAVKTIRIPQNRYQDDEKNDKLVRLKKELTNFRTLSCHPNIVDFYGLCFNDGEALICMELMDMSLYDLYLVVHDREEKFPEEILGYVAAQVLEALGFCKSKNFIHRDVKPKNILLNTKGEVKLCDFGEARILKDSLASTFVGTIAYWPPERFETNKPVKEISTIPQQEQNALTDEDVFRYDVRSDIWSLGITLAETAYGKLPFVNDNGEEISRENNRQENIVTIQHCILSTKTDELVQRCFGDNYSGDFIEFVNMCLEKLDKRPKFDGLMKTKFYQKFRENVKQKDMAAFIKNYEEDDASESNQETTQKSKHDNNVWSQTEPASTRERPSKSQPWPTI
uniref:mitogen-activated protein kinase kinase n=1 Tax=Acrobeloides nanus TaxID=290746 RepID=A0A914D1C2_9BILA